MSGPVEPASDAVQVALTPSLPPCRLRSFPVPSHFVERATGPTGYGANGETSVEWQQSQGQVMLIHRIEGQLPERRPWTEDKVKVEMSSNRLKVLLAGEPLKALTGELLGHVFVFKSWWVVEDGCIIINLYKRELNSWKFPWHGSTQGMFKRQAFPWTQQMRELGGAHNSAGHGNPNLKDVPKEEELEEKAPGRPEVEAGEPLPDGSGVVPALPGGLFAARSPLYMCAPDDLCLGVTAEQTSHFVIVEVHFEAERYEQLKARYPLEALLAADVWDNAVSIFFQGDKQNPIIWGELNGKIDPQATTWRITSSDSMRSRQISATKYSPCLQVKLPKRPAGATWPKVFRECWQHKLMVKEITEEGPQRFQGIENGKTFYRAGYNLNDPDFWGNVDGYVNATMKRGIDSAPRKLP